MCYIGYHLWLVVGEIDGLGRLGLVSLTREFPSSTKPPWWEWGWRWLCQWWWYLLFYLPKVKHFLTLGRICRADFDVIFCTRDREGETIQDKNETKEILDMLWNATETSRDNLGWKYAINCPPSHSDFRLHSTWSTFKFYFGGNQKLEFARVVKSFGGLVKSRRRQLLVTAVDWSHPSACPQFYISSQSAPDFRSYIISFWCQKYDILAHLIWKGEERKNKKCNSKATNDLSSWIWK